MRIGFEATSLLQPAFSGISLYTSELLKALSQKKELQLELYFNLTKFSKRKFIAQDFPFRHRWFRDKLWPLKHDKTICHSTDSYLLNLKKTKKIYTVHDLAIFHKEHQFDLYAPREFVQKARRKITSILQQTDQIITISQSSADDVVRFFNFPVEKIKVIYPGANHFNNCLGYEWSSEVEEKFHISAGNYFFFAGHISVRKNLLNVIKAFARFENKEIPYLVLSGSPSVGYENIVDLVSKLKLNDKVIFTGYLPTKLLRVLYRHCRAVIFPTFYEGFGFPILEAMLNEKPVLIGNRGSAPEIAQNHGVQADPFDIESITGGMSEVLDISAVALQKARSHASTFTWQRSASEILKLYEKLS